MIMAINKDVSRQKGEAAERFAETFLNEKGLHLIAKNYRCKLGEIDLIMRDGEVIVFIEVRLRSNRFFASAAETVTHAKQQRLIRTADVYLQQHQQSNAVRCRFDVIALDQSSRGNYHTEWIRNAFDTH
jgi:putative endonuclease